MNHQQEVEQDGQRKNADPPEMAAKASGTGEGIRHSDGEKPPRYSRIKRADAATIAERDRLNREILKGVRHPYVPPSKPNPAPPIS